MWFVVASVIVAVVAAVVMDWAIILLSSLAGAAAIVEPFKLKAIIAAAALVGLAVVRVAVQGRRLRRGAPIGRPIH